MDLEDGERILMVIDEGEEGLSSGLDAPSLSNGVSEQHAAEVMSGQEVAGAESSPEEDGEVMVSDSATSGSSEQASESSHAASAPDSEALATDTSATSSVSTSDSVSGSSEAGGSTLDASPQQPESNPGDGPNPKGDSPTVGPGGFESDFTPTEPGAADGGGKAEVEEGLQLGPEGGSKVRAMTKARGNGEFGFDGLGSREGEYVEAKVAALAQAGEGAVLFLEINGLELPLRMVVGPAEAMAVLGAAQERRAKRPVTHEAWGNTLEAVGWKVERLVITSLYDNTFYSRLVLSAPPSAPSPPHSPAEETSRKGKKASPGLSEGAAVADSQASEGNSRPAQPSVLRSIDMRPSDGIALALRSGSPIFIFRPVAEAVVADARSRRAEESKRRQQLSDPLKQPGLLAWAKGEGEEEKMGSDGGFMEGESGDAVAGGGRSIVCTSLEERGEQAGGLTAAGGACGAGFLDLFYEDEKTKGAASIHV